MDFQPSRRTQLTTQPTSQRQPYERLRPIKRRRALNRPRLIAAIVSIAILAGIGLYFLKSRQSPTTASPISPQANNTPAQNNQITQSNPTFKVLTPSGKPISWSHLTPPSGTDFYVYTDTINGVAIRVSEQTLPKSLGQDTAGQLAELAKQYNTTRTLTAAGTTIYIGSSIKGQQSLLFTSGQLLIMITSNSLLNDHQWTDYINSLQ